MDKRGFALTTTTILIIAIALVSVSTLAVITYSYVQTVKGDVPLNDTGTGVDDAAGGGSVGNTNLANNATHLVCLSNTCTRVAGAGTNTCSVQGATCGTSSASGGGGGGGSNNNNGGSSGPTGALTIISPSEGQTFGYNTSILLNYTLVNNTASACWYNLDSGTIQILPNCNITWFNVSSGTHNVYVYANVTGGTLSDSNAFTINLNAPTISLIYPVNNSGSSSRNVTFTYVPSENPSSDLSYCELWGDFTGTFAKNQTNNAPTADTNNLFYLYNLPDRTYKWAVSCVDKENNRGVTGNLSFIIDTIGPRVYVAWPKGTYTDLNIPLNFSFTDLNPVTICNYNVYNISGVRVVGGSIPNCLNRTIPGADGPLPNGIYSINVTVYDPALNQGSNVSSFTVNVSTNASSGQNATLYLNANPTTGAAPLNVLFNYSGYDPLGIYIFEIEYGDGAGLGYANNGSSLTVTDSPNHVYITNGTYLVNLTMVGGSGTRSITQTITVTNNSEGTNSSWISICTPQDLYNVRNNLTANYIQTCNIDLNGYSSWVSITNNSQGGSCDQGRIFSGTYNGNGYSISNLRINNTGLPEQFLCIQENSLFGTVSGTLANITLVNINVQNKNWIGAAGLASTIIAGNVENCHVSGNVASPVYGGGLVGSVFVGRILDSSSSVTLLAGDPSNPNRNAGSSGGLAGNVQNAVIQNSSATGNVIVNYNENGTYFAQSIGGLIGTTYHVNINNSYASGNVHGSFVVGGLVGDGNGANISNSYASGNVIKHNYSLLSNGNFGGIAGSLSLGAIYNSYASGNVTGTQEVGGLVGLSTGSNISRSYAAGNVNGLNRVGGLVGRLNGGGLDNVGAEGAVNCINGVALNSTLDQNTLWYWFGVGGLVGDATPSPTPNFPEITVSKAYASGNVNSTNCYLNTGGLVGSSYVTLISDSYATGNVSSTSNYTAGLIGQIYLSSIDNVYSKGRVQGAPGMLVGGLFASGQFGNSIVSSYWDTQTSGQATSSGGTGKTTNEMKTQSTYIGWDFTNIWEQIVPGNSYPTLRWESGNCGPLGCSPPISGFGSVLSFVIIIHAMVLGALIASFVYLRRKEKKEQALARYSMNSSVLNRVGREHLKY